MFKQFRDRLIANFNTNFKGLESAFEVDIDKDEIYATYINSFNPIHNPIYRKQTYHSCSCCRQFIKNVGGMVKIEDGKLSTIWDFDAESEIYQPVINALSSYVRSKAITDIFLHYEAKVGVLSNFENADGKVNEYSHFYLELPPKFVKNKDSIATLKGRFRDTRNVFKRSLDEITVDSLLTVLELISQNSLYKGEEWKGVLEKFLTYKRAYDKAENKELFAWEYAVKVGDVIGKIRNHSIGTLLVNISEDMDLDLAVKKYEAIVAPESYKRPKAIFTKKMLEDAEKKITELGYLDSLPRRFATLNDITVNNILFANRDIAPKLKTSIFDDMRNDVANISPKNFGKIEEISIDNFIKNVLPTAEKLELFLENSHAKNLVSLIAPQDKDSKTMFKWDNNFSWSYKGNITDSSMKQNVKNAGGNVEGDLRFSIQWNDITRDNCDLDAHCIEATGYELYFSNRSRTSQNGGRLDVDIINPKQGESAVENITYASRDTMRDGEYKFFVNYFSGRTTSGFRAEIEFDGTIYSFEQKDNKSGKIPVATVTLKDGKFTIKEHIPSSLSSRDLWDVKTQQFVPVSTVMYSPNYWNQQKGIGNKHFLFMLKGCKNDESPNGFYNEFLNNELLEHKRVFEALGTKMRVEDSDEQLSGLGFSSTQSAEFMVKVIGATQRILKVKI